MKECGLDSSGNVCATCCSLEFPNWGLNRDCFPARLAHTTFIMLECIPFSFLTRYSSEVVDRQHPCPESLLTIPVPMQPAIRRYLLRPSQ